MASEILHEDPEELGPEVIDQHRAIVSLMEELEAVDWYNQRAKVTADDELRSILEHNRDEEKEHAVMVLEWLRRHDTALDTQLRKYLFRTGPIRDTPESGEAESQSDDGLAIGNLQPPKE